MASASTLEAAIADQDAELDRYRRLLLGLRDFLSDEVTPETKSHVDDFRARLAHRADVTNAALVANKALLADGFPDVAVLEVPLAVTADLDAQLAAEQAARAFFQAATEPAVSGGSFTLGTPEAKP